MAPPPERPLLNRKTWPLFALGAAILIAAAGINARESVPGPNRFYSRPLGAQVHGLDCGEQPLLDNGNPVGMALHLQSTTPADLRCTPAELTARCWRTRCTWHEPSPAGAPIERQRTFYLGRRPSGQSPVIGEE